MDGLNWLWLCYPLLGCVAGFMAGLLGVGGGLISVPFITIILTASGMHHPDLHKIALATSTTTILFTAFSSMRSHVSHHNVEWPAVKGILPGIILGTLIGTYLVHFIPTVPLRIIFIAFTFYTAYSMTFGGQPKASRSLPNSGWLFAVGTLIGGISTLISAGGGFITVPFLIACNIPVRKAIGTSATLGFPIAVSGVLWYLISFHDIKGLPPHTIAYIYWPAVVGVVATSMLFAPLGARAAQVWPIATIKKIFALLLFSLGLHMLYTLVSSPLN